MILEALLPHQVMEAATRNGHKQVVRTLLDTGADVNAQCGGYGNALQAASEQGHEAVVKMLVAWGAKSS
jgi:ankyrin repeat protein